MIIGFLGKGGSGKSTLSYRFTRYLLDKGYRVLAMDADHNMDFAHNLGMQQPFPYLGEGWQAMKKYAGVPEGSHYSLLLLEGNGPSFSLQPVDPYTETYSLAVTDQLRVMAAGPSTDDVRHDKSCSHILSTPLKLYLPSLKLNNREAVVVDQTAGLDGVSTGIPTGFNFAFICTEPTEHGLKVAKQLAEELTFYGVPYQFIVNKVHDPTDRAFADNFLAPEKPFGYLSYRRDYIRPSGDTMADDVVLFAEMEAVVQEHIVAHGDARLMQTQRKFARNKAFKENQT